MELLRVISGRSFYLHYQYAHADGAQEVLVVVQPLLHLLVAALRGERKASVKGSG